MNYSELVSNVRSYTEVDSNVLTNALVDTFIKQAEQRIFNTVQFPSIRKNVTGTTTSNNKYLSSPSDFLAPYSLAVVDGSGDYTYLQFRDVNFIREVYPTPTSTGLPKYYALFGPTTTNDSPPVVTNELSFILGPTPNANYSVELHYYYYPESIVDSSSGQTWLGDNFDSVLMYGSILEAYTYLKGDQTTMAFYEKRYAEALALAKRLGDGMERQDAYTYGQARLPVK